MACTSPAMVPAAEEEARLQKGCDLQVTPVLRPLPAGSRAWVSTSSTLGLRVVRNGPVSVTCTACQATEASCFVSIVREYSFRKIIQSLDPKPQEGSLSLQRPAGMLHTRPAPGLAHHPGGTDVLDLSFMVSRRVRSHANLQLGGRERCDPIACGFIAP